MTDIFRVAEIFTSINGEGPLAGQTAVFVRFAGCNLSCRYCDTAWANQPDVPFTELTGEEILSRILDTGIRNVTLTGGEPLLRPGIRKLITRLCAEPDLHVEIETNGSIDLDPFTKLPIPPSFTMDYKLPCSGMEAHMHLANFSILTEKDTVKFVVGSLQDCERALAIMQQYALIGRCHIYLSPVFGQIEPAQIVDFMIRNRCNQVNLQLQLHKYIWDPEQRGV